MHRVKPHELIAYNEESSKEIIDRIIDMGVQPTVMYLENTYLIDGEAFSMLHAEGLLGAGYNGAAYLYIDNIKQDVFDELVLSGSLRQILTPEHIKQLVRSAIESRAFRASEAQFKIDTQWPYLKSLVDRINDLLSDPAFLFDYTDESKRIYLKRETEEIGKEILKEVPEEEVLQALTSFCESQDHIPSGASYLQKVFSQAELHPGFKE